MGRLPGDKEQKFLKSWEDMGFSPEMVKEACDRTLLNCGKPNFNYANKLLVSWNEEGIKSLEALTAKDNSFNAAKAAAKTAKVSGTRGMSRSAENYINRYSQRDYSASDMLEIERQMLAKTLDVSNK